MSLDPAPEPSIRQLQFLVTEACNLDCVYCYERHKTRRSLSPDFMRQKIREAMLAEDRYETILVDFFGGEPLIKFDNIRKVVEWCEAQDWAGGPKRLEYGIATNGTLLDDARKAWFSARKDRVRLCLSMDGTPQAQNRNRSHSFAKLEPHLAFFRDNWPDQPVKMTISQHTIDQVYEGVVFLHGLGFAVDADVVFEDVWGDERSLSASVESFTSQLERLATYYADHKSVPRPDILTRPITRVFSRGWSRDKTLCRTGKDLTCYTAKGEAYPCMRFSPIATQASLARIEDSPEGENERCSACVFVALCPTCKGHNFQDTGSAWKRTTYNCRFFQASLLASARLLLLDEPELLEPTDDPDAAQARMTKLMAIRAVNDWCDLKGFPAGANATPAAVAG